MRKIEEGIGAGLDVPKNIKELKPEEKEKWEEYLRIGEVSRGQALDLVSRNITGLFQNIPDVRYVEMDKEAMSMYTSAVRSKYQLILSFFPNLTDGEAKKFFGQLSDADKVHKMATGKDIVAINEEDNKN